MSAYAESESMALKRLKVALKRKDWQMFEYGLSRTIDLINSGTKISEIQEWYRILEHANNEPVPEEQLEKLSNIVENILSPAAGVTVEKETQVTQAEGETDAHTEVTKTITLSKTPDIPIVVYIHEDISPEQSKIIRKVRYNLNKLCLDPDADIDKSFLPSLSRLIKSFNSPLSELNGLGNLLKNYPEPGIIITTSYNSQIINILEENEINYSIEGVTKPEGEGFWKVYPLSGMTSIYWCPECNSRTFYHNKGESIVTICKKCSSPAYPDLYLMNSNYSQINPALWYQTFRSLANSSNWLFVSPPNAQEQQPLSNLVLDACYDAIIKNAFIVSTNSDLGTWWKNRIASTNPKASVSPVCYNIDIAFNNYITAVLKQSQEQIAAVESKINQETQPALQKPEIHTITVPEEQVILPTSNDEPDAFPEDSEY